MRFGRRLGWAAAVCAAGIAVWGLWGSSERAQHAGARPAGPEARPGAQDATASVRGVGGAAVLPEVYEASATDGRGNVRRTVFPADGMGPSAALAAIAGAGGEVLGWNPEGGYDALMPADGPGMLAAQGLRTALSPLPVSPELRRRLSESERVRAVLVCRDEGAAGEVAARLGGIRVQDTVTVQDGESAAVSALLAEHAGILAADIRRTAQPANDVACGARFIGADPLRAGGNWLTGRGEVVAVFDTGLSTGLRAEGTGLAEGFHPGLADRLIRLSLQPWGALLDNVSPAAPSTGYDFTGHGTHVAGSVLGTGAGSAEGRYRGVVPDARLFFQNQLADGSDTLHIPPTPEVLMREAYAAGARIHSNSWSSGGYGDRGISYSLEAWSLDRFVWEHPDFLPLFAAGNSGSDEDRNGVADSGTIASAPARAKNVLTVGAAESYRLPGNAAGVVTRINSEIVGNPGEPLALDSLSAAPGDNPDVRGMALFSCRGPLADGRIKPDVAAPGTRIVSAAGPEPVRGGSANLAETAGNTPEERALYRVMDGTSMATPLTAGACAAIRQWCRETDGRKDPGAALIRALLIAGCAPMGPGQFGDGGQREIPEVVPNGAEGFGLISLERSLTPECGMPETVEFRCQETGGTEEWSIEVGTEGTLRAVLCWIDYPAPLYVQRTLINDLDLELLDASGAVVAYPNGGTGPDRVNVTERIVADVTPGTYTLRVRSHAVPFPGGSAALAVQVPGTGEPFVAHAPVERLTPGAAVSLSARLLWPSSPEDRLTLMTSADGQTWTAVSDLTLRAPASGPFFYRLEAPGAETGPYAVAVGPDVTLSVRGQEGFDYLATPSVGQQVRYAAGETVTASARETPVQRVADGQLISEIRTVGGWMLTDDASGAVLALGAGETAAFAMPAAPVTLTWQTETVREEAWVSVTLRGQLQAVGSGPTAIWLPAGSTFVLPDAAPAGESGFVAQTAWESDTGRRYAPGAQVGPLAESIVFNPIYAPWQDVWFPDGGYDAAADTDGDGYTDGEEARDLTNPFDPASVPQPPVLIPTEPHPVRSPCAQRIPQRTTLQATDNARIEAVCVQTRLPGDTAWRRTEIFGALANAAVTPLGPETLYRIGVADGLGADAFAAGDTGHRHIVWTEPQILRCPAGGPWLLAEFDGAAVTVCNLALPGTADSDLTVTVRPECYRSGLSHTWSWPDGYTLTPETPLSLPMPWGGSPAAGLDGTFEGDCLPEGDPFAYAVLRLTGRDGVTLSSEAFVDGDFSTAFSLGANANTPWTGADFLHCRAETGGAYSVRSLEIIGSGWVLPDGADPETVTLAPGEIRIFRPRFGTVPPSERRLVLRSGDTACPVLILGAPPTRPGYRLRLR